MNLSSLFSEQTSRRQTDWVVTILSQRPQLLTELFRIIYSYNEPESRRAIWALDLLDEKEPELVEPFINEIIEQLKFNVHDAFKRHSLRILARHTLPEESLTRVFDFCLEIVTGNEATAAKVHAMDILYKLAKSEPALTNEVEAAISLGSAEGSPGLKNCGAKMLRKLRKN